MNKFDKYGQPLERAVPMTPAELAEKAAQDMQEAYEDAIEAAQLVRMIFVPKSTCTPVAIPPSLLLAFILSSYFLISLCFDQYCNYCLPTILYLCSSV